MRSENLLLFNLKKMGLIKDDTTMGELIIGQYKFVFRRENAELWITDNSYKYKCYIDIFDNLTNILILALNLNEDDVMNVLDCYTQMNDFGMQDIIVPALKPFSSNGNYFIIKIDQFRIIDDMMSDMSKRWFCVMEYNPLTELVIDRISIEMYVDQLEELMDIMYFIFLIDLEPENPLIPYNMSPSEYTRYNKNNI